jgi:hypothetical protein
VTHLHNLGRHVVPTEFHKCWIDWLACGKGHGRLNKLMSEIWTTPFFLALQKTNHLHFECVFARLMTLMEHLVCIIPSVGEESIGGVDALVHQYMRKALGRMTFLAVQSGREWHMMRGYRTLQSAGSCFLL